MAKVKYKGYAFIPYGNITGKDDETQVQRLMWRTDTLTPLLCRDKDGFDYHDFINKGKVKADIYFCPETNLHYVPTAMGMCKIDVAAQKKYIKLIPPTTQEELMAKVETALKNSISDEERTGDKWGLFRGLELAPLSQDMIDLLYDKDDVTEEMMDFVIEQSSEDFEYGCVDFSNMQEIACEYLESLERQTAQEDLTERAEKELSLYIQTLRNDIISRDDTISDDGIVIKAYRLTIMNEMLIYLQDAEALDADELKALLTLEKPLDYLYNGWIGCDVNIKDSIIDVVSDTVDRLTRNLEDKERGYLDEDEDEMEM